MEYRYLGKSGLRVSAVSLGSWITFGEQIDERVAQACMTAAFDAGVNFFDNAEVYADGESERVMGRILRAAQWQRDSFLVSTKIFWGGRGPNQRGLSRKHIVEGMNAALQRLQLDYVDLVFCHRPDHHTPMEETVWAMNHVVNQGKALYWGTSEWSAQQIMQAHAIARREHLIPPTMEQPEYNMLHRDRVEEEYRFLYTDIGLGTTVWSPLAGGLLTGKHNDATPPGTRATLSPLRIVRERFHGDAAAGNKAKVRALAPIASELGCTMPQLALAWCLKNPNVSSAITGATRPEHVRENVGAVDVATKLIDGVMERIESILNNRPASQPDVR